MKRKEAVYKGLEFVPVYFQDTSLTSPDYFQITEFPTRLTAGKNLFKRVFLFYYEGFKSMTLGKRLWLIIQRQNL
jgi:hypothetical protein